MTEENGTNKVEIQYHANMDVAGGIPSDKRLVSSIGSGTKCLQKYEIYFLVPSTDEEAKERYDCTLADLVASGVRQITTRPDYKTVGFDIDQEPEITPDPGNPKKPFVDYPTKEGGHAAMQAMADGYKVGQRATATGGQKAKAQKWDVINGMFGALGISGDDIAECEGDQVKLAAMVARKTKEMAKKAR